MARSTPPIPYRSETVTVRFEPALCIHTGNCIRGLPEVFNTQEKPWVHPQRADADAIVATVGRCPSGALTTERCDEGAEEKPDRAATAVIRPKGPLYLRGQITLELEDGSRREMIRLALCRCGASKNKPFCDNSHQEAGFNDLGSAQAMAEIPETVVLHTPVLLRPQRHGPVLFVGPLEIRTARGEVCFRGEKGALCRCGGSATKPFCDGAHNTNGFHSA